MSKDRCIWNNTTASRKRTRTKRYNEESWQAGRHTPNAGYIFKSNLAMYNSCALPAMIYGAETWTMTKQAQNKVAAAQTKVERSMLNIAYNDRRTNIWVRERTQVIYTIICLKSVDVRRQQVAILARSPREMSQTDRILPRYFLSWVRVSVRPRIFVYAKKLPNHSRPDHWPSAPPTVRTAQQFERHFISSCQVATYVTILTNGYGWFCWRPKTTPV